MFLLFQRCIFRFHVSFREDMVEQSVAFEGVPVFFIVVAFAFVDFWNQPTFFPPWYQVPTWFFADYVWKSWLIYMIKTTMRKSRECLKIQDPSEMNGRRCRILRQTLKICLGESSRTTEIFLWWNGPLNSSDSAWNLLDFGEGRLLLLLRLLIFCFQQEVVQNMCIAVFYLGGCTNHFGNQNCRNWSHFWFAKLVVIRSKDVTSGRLVNEFLAFSSRKKDLNMDSTKGKNCAVSLTVLPHGNVFRKVAGCTRKYMG